MDESEAEAQERRRAQIAAWAKEGRFDEPEGSRDATLSPTFLIHATPERFLRWLSSLTHRAEWRKFQTSKGYFTLQAARQEDRTGQSLMNPIVFTIDALFHELSGGTILLTRAIYFSINPLAEGQISVQPTCGEPDITPYYEYLLQELEKQWAT